MTDDGESALLSDKVFKDAIGADNVCPLLLNKKKPIERIAVTDEVIHGDKAIVSYALYYDATTFDAVSTGFLLQNGAWKITPVSRYGGWEAFRKAAPATSPSATQSAPSSAPHAAAP